MHTSDVNEFIIRAKEKKNRKRNTFQSICLFKMNENKISNPKIKRLLKNYKKGSSFKETDYE